MAGVGVLLAIEQICYNFVSTPITVILVVLIGGLASGLYFSTTIEYAFRLAPSGLRLPLPKPFWAWPRPSV